MPWWVPVLVLVAMSLTLTVSMLRGGRLGERWYTGGKSRMERDGEGNPIDPTDNVRGHRR